MTNKTELTVYFDNLPREGKNIRVVMANSRTLKEHSGGGRIYGPSLVFSDIEKKDGDRHYFEVVVLDSSDQVIDKVYINADLPQKKNIVTVSLVGGIWSLDREIIIGDRVYDRIVMSPLDEKRAASTHGTHSFYLANSKNGYKTGAGTFCYHVTDRECSLYGVQEMGSVTGVANPETIVVCNENLSNLDLPEGVIIDATLRNSLFTARDYPYTVGSIGDHRIEFGLLVAQSTPKRANIIQSVGIADFREKLKELSSSLAYQHSLLQIDGGKGVLLRDVAVVQFRKQCSGQYKVFPYRYSSVTFISAIYDIAIQKVRAVKVI